MPYVQYKPTTLFLVIFPILFIACRNEDGLKLFQTDPVTIMPPPAEHGALPIKRAADDAIPTTMPPTPPKEEDKPIFATELYFQGGCDQSPVEVAVMRQRQTPALCEHVTVIPVMADDGDLYEIGLPITWEVDDPGVALLACLYSPNNEHCGLYGAQDIFDAQGMSEPHTVVTACAQNDCPENESECPEQVCNSTMIKVVVNLEGSWLIEGVSLNEPSLANIEQDGRWFAGSDVLTGGMIHNTHVEFKIGDYGFEGTISSDRNTMSGDVIDLLSYSHLGSWSASRLTTL